MIYNWPVVKNGPETWLINESPVTGTLWNDNQPFTCNGVRYVMATSGLPSSGKPANAWVIYYYTEDGNKETVAYTQDRTQLQYYPVTWYDTRYRTITFDKPATGKSVLGWLQVNAVKQ